MESIEIFEQISNRLVEATMMHNSFDELLMYLGFEGFAKIHHYQFYDETHEMKMVNEYAVEHLNYLIYNEQVDAKKYIPNEFKNVSRSDVNRLDKRDVVRYIMETWVAWETATKELYSNFEVDLSEKHDIASTLFVDKLIQSVDYELRRATDLLTLLQSCDYDLDTIVVLQNRYKAMYCGMIISMFKEMKGENEYDRR